MHNVVWGCAEILPNVYMQKMELHYWREIVKRKQEQTTVVELKVLVDTVGIKSVGGLNSL